MKNNLEHPINCETGELNRPVGMAEAGQEDSDEPEGLAGTAYSREFGRGFKAGRESSQKIERAEPSPGGAPEATHTPGPWEHTNDIPLSVWAHGVWVATTNVETIRDFNERAANARLIAQAPTLLAENEKLRAGHVVLLEALKAAKQEMMGLAAYLETCEELVIIANLPSLAKSLHLQAAVAEAAIKQAERT